MTGIVVDGTESLPLPDPLLTPPTSDFRPFPRVLSAPFPPLACSFAPPRRASPTFPSPLSPLLPVRRSPGRWIVSFRGAAWPSCVGGSTGSAASVSPGRKPTSAGSGGASGARNRSGRVISPSTARATAAARRRARPPSRVRSFPPPGSTGWPHLSIRWFTQVFSPRRTILSPETGPAPPPRYSPALLWPIKNAITNWS